MKILLISTCKERLHELEFVKPIEDILSASDVGYFVKHYRELDKKDLDMADKVIICGTSLADFDYLMNFKRFDWIKDFKNPVLGICAGSQILVNLFGGRIFERGKKILDRKEIGFVVCSFKKVFLGLDGNMEVYGLHQVGIGISGKKSFLEAYGFSNKGLQAFKHKEKNIYGVLFHPEVRQKQLIEEFVKNG